ncbi:MAG: hypothetical protein E6189_18345 [Clostridium sp.]|nr:hypothetical protein [Clostridium sp.]
MGLLLLIKKNHKPITILNSRDEKYTYLKRSYIFDYLWMYFKLSERKKNYICANYPNAFSLRKCVMKFRELFKKKNLVLFYIFIEKYINIYISSFIQKKIPSSN